MGTIEYEKIILTSNGNLISVFEVEENNLKDSDWYRLLVGLGDSLPNDITLKTNDIINTSVLVLTANYEAINVELFNFHITNFEIICSSLKEVKIKITKGIKLAEIANRIN